MDTVYLLYVWEHEDRHVERVFATRAAAQAWINHVVLEPGGLSRREIVEEKVVS